MAADLTVRNSVAVADPDAPARVIKPNSDGSINVVNAGGVTTPSIGGGEYNSTPPTLTNGQTDAVQFDSRGNQKVAITGSDSATGVQAQATGADGSGNTINGLRTIAYLQYFNGTTWDRARGDTTGLYTVDKGVPTIAAGQITVAATATSIVAARAGRSKVTIVNSGAVDVFLGPAGVTITTGILLNGVKGSSVELNTSAAIFGIAASGTQVVSFIETY